MLDEDFYHWPKLKSLCLLSSRVIVIHHGAWLQVFPQPWKEEEEEVVTIPRQPSSSQGHSKTRSMEDIVGAQPLFPHTPPCLLANSPSEAERLGSSL